jgi:tRNA nucleotidyltransferase (CCA-adding enzyme)
LPAEQVHAVCSRLRLPVVLRAALLASGDLRRDLPGLASAKPSEAFARLEDVPLPAVFAVWLGAAPEGRTVLENFVVRWRHVRPATDGHELQRRGLPPGPVYQKILRRLRQAWLDGDVTSPEQENALLETLLKEK